MFVAGLNDLYFKVTVMQDFILLFYSKNSTWAPLLNRPKHFRLVIDCTDTVSAYKLTTLTFCKLFYFRKINYNKW